MSKKIHSRDLNFSIQEWITSILSVPNPTFNNLPACPYAKQAWLDNKVIIKTFNNFVDAYSEIVTRQYNFDEYDVLVYAFPPTLTPEQLSNSVDYLNEKWPHSDVVILEDHPHELEAVKGFRLNFGESCLLLIQSRSKLNKARSELEQKGYYKNWSKKYKDEVQNR